MGRVRVSRPEEQVGVGGGGGGGTVADWDSLPTNGTMDNTAYLATGVRTAAAGTAYSDPATGTRVIKCTSATYPATSTIFYHHYYSEGSNKISGDLGGGVHTIIVQNQGGNPYLIDVTRGGGVSNARVAPVGAEYFSFSNDPAEYHIAYVVVSGSINRYNTLTMANENTGNFPRSGVAASTNGSGPWFSHDMNQDYFCWIEGNTTVECWRASTNVSVSRSFTGLDEPYIDMDGRYILLGATTPVVWDVDTDTTAGVSLRANHGFGHVPSMRGYFLDADSNSGGGVLPMDRIPSTSPGSDTPATNLNGYIGQWHRSCWPQPAGTSQRFLLSAFDDPSGDQVTSIGIYGIGYYGIDNTTYQRLLCHSYTQWAGVSTTNSYEYYTGMPKAQPSPDGKMVIFTSNMRNVGRGDVFVAEVPLA